VVLLIDTYDTETAASTVVTLVPRLADEGIVVRAVRLDSGDLAAHATRVRRIFDEANLPDIKIFASGGLDERQLQDLVASGVPVDGFGVGTSMATSVDAPYLDCAYKLQVYDGTPRRKRSEGKATWPGSKQVFRQYASDGHMVADCITVEDDVQAGEPLLHPVMRSGRRVTDAVPLSVSRQLAAEQIMTLPEHFKRLETTPAYTVNIAPALEAMARTVDATGA